MAENETPGLAYAWPLYQGTKQLKAQPMNKADYCQLRGWTVPADEDPAEPGYVVEYQDGGTPNLEGYAGYVSWSPAHVFDAAYYQCGSHVQRMRIEFEELGERYDKLHRFIHRSPAYGNLDPVEQGLLKAQHSSMAAYLEVLDLRLGLAEGRANG